MDPAVIASVPEQDRQAISNTSLRTTTRLTGKNNDYFVKCGSPDPIEAESYCLKWLAKAVPDSIPKLYGCGPLQSNPAKWFMTVSYLDLRGGNKSADAKMAKMLAKLHSTQLSDTFGLPDSRTTYCGPTPQPNPPTTSWTDFYATHRLKYILDLNQKEGHWDSQFSQLAHKTVNTVIPTLLNPLDIKPSLVHGDLWAGNAAYIQVSNELEPVIFDPSCTFAHNEYELALMKMFGGFSATVFDEYHKIIPKSHPESQYADRLALYELYHQLNHSFLFGGGGYYSSAEAIMSRLVSKYG
ncbi:hypothetical protein CANCADRAFT_31163 [Tortispora caseinolytica NRRL Y-17796]|uniref:protein-ribulosamine 3-kinase n=1 Tax=Tortispora caseinolytica NRRL Y-17796 TaxID=767744 RepID=A0A1E4TEC2_9ASCO|nr:hypothetical protein CANCADRAFT_31163 [Tortispora caseinolytica NRRL Y-17796]